jgi:hypothetical protein
MHRRARRAGLLLAVSLLALTSAARAGETVAYRYDSLGRLVQVRHCGSVNGGLNADYSYDLADNRTRVTVTGAPPPSSPPPPPPPPPPSPPPPATC